jgi:hypothetical protein
MEDHDRLAQGVERQLDDMQRKSDQLDESIEDVRTDWRRKQEDESVPGADRPDDDERDDQPPAEMERQ